MLSESRFAYESNRLRLKTHISRQGENFNFIRVQKGLIDNLCYSLEQQQAKSMERKKQFSRTNIRPFKIERLIEFMVRFDSFVMNVKRSTVLLELSFDWIAK